MASNVVVLCPNGRRQTVKVSPNTRILEIIETVCLKQKFQSDEYNLKHQRTVLDVQVPFRYANLPNNAKLELVKTDRPRGQTGPTLVALQLPTGERVQHSFDSSTSLWQLLQHWEEGRDGPSLTRPASGSDETLHPVCIYMREEVTGEAWLKATTLKGLGLSGGKAIIRLLHRNVELPPPPKPTPAKTDAKIITPAQPTTPQCEVVQSVSQSNTGTLGQTIGAEREATANQLVPEANARVSPVAAERDTHPSNELAPSASANGAAADCSITEEREETPMDVEAGDTSSRGTETASVTCEEREAANLSQDNTASERVVRPKELPDTSKPSTSKTEGGGSEDGTVQETMKNIEDSTGLSLDEYAKRRIHSLLEKEEEMVTSMQMALMESLSQQASSLHHQPSRTETRPPRQSFADFKFPESRTANEKKSANEMSNGGKGKAAVKSQALSQPCDRSQLVFSVGQDVAMAPVEVPDGFFDVTVDDVRRMLSDLRHQSGESEKELETRAMREAREQMQMRKYEKVVIRVHFPDRVILQGFFRPLETVGAVKEFVKSNLADKDQEFYLYTAPPKTVLKDVDESVFKAKLFPAAVVYFGTNEHRDHYLHEDVLGELASLLQAESVVAKNMNTGCLKAATTGSSGPSTSGSTSGSAPSSAAGASTSDDPAGGQGSASNGQKRQAPHPGAAVESSKVPKWFKMGKR